MGPISMGNNRSDGERGYRVTGGEAAIATHHRAFTFKPGIPVIAVWCERDRADPPVDVFQNCGYNFSIENSFSCEQRSVLHLRIPAREPYRIE